MNEFKVFSAGREAAKNVLLHFFLGLTASFESIIVGVEAVRKRRRFTEDERNNEAKGEKKDTATLRRPREKVIKCVDR